jgi:beta-galactosidase
VLQADRAAIASDGQDLSIIDVMIVDARGRVVPDADNLLRFEVKGPGKIIGVGNGDPSSHESDKASERHAFNGCAQVILQAARAKGTIELVANSPLLKSARVKIKTKPGQSAQAALP